MVRQGQKMDAYYEIADSCALDKCMERAKKNLTGKTVGTLL